MTYFVVQRRSGPEWDPALDMREQVRWDEHAAFMDALVEAGFILLGGPLDDDGSRAVHVVEASSEDAVRARFADDPWSGSLLEIESVRRWTILLDGLGVTG